ncbi:MAG: sulfotransferase [Chloroflexi bacterium]|nr:sulfotransferase [Chloroflexota bacterium]
MTTEPEAIFVVGVSRSGTTLMRRVLGSHSRIAIATENHYLGHLLPWEGARSYFRRLGDLHDDATIDRIVDLIYSGEFQHRSPLRELSPYWRWLTRVIEPDEMRQRLLASDRTERGTFTVLMRVFADHKRKPIMGEKTPAHLAWAHTLLEWYPGARIVHMVRDPRGVYVSELRRRVDEPGSVPYRWLERTPRLLRTFVLGEVSWAWARAEAQHRDLARTEPDRYRMVRFEDLVGEPVGTLETVCRFLGVEFEPSMLDQRVTSKGATKGQDGFDAGAADRWRQSIGPAEEAWLEHALGVRMRRFGYEV